MKRYPPNRAGRGNRKGNKKLKAKIKTDTVRESKEHCCCYPDPNFTR